MGNNCSAIWRAILLFICGQQHSWIDVQLGWFFFLKFKVRIWLSSRFSNQLHGHYKLGRTHRKLGGHLEVKLWNNLLKIVHSDIFFTYWWAYVTLIKGHQDIGQNMATKLLNCMYYYEENFDLSRFPLACAFDQMVKSAWKFSIEMFNVYFTCYGGLKSWRTIIIKFKMPMLIHMAKNTYACISTWIHTQNICKYIIHSFIRWQG